MYLGLVCFLYNTQVYLLYIQEIIIPMRIVI